MSECNNSNPSPYEISRTCKANIDYICSIKYTANSRKAELELWCSQLLSPVGNHISVARIQDCVVLYMFPYYQKHSM